MIILVHEIGHSLRRHDRFLTVVSIVNVIGEDKRSCWLRIEKVLDPETPVERLAGRPLPVTPAERLVHLFDALSAENERAIRNAVDIAQVRGWDALAELEL